MQTREGTIYRVTLVGSVCNAVLLAFKAVAGFVGNSPAMVADAVHSLSDFVTDIFVLLFVRLSNKPQDDDHAYGHGKYETLATALIGLSLLFVGFVLLKDAALRIWDFAHGAELPQPGYIALAAAAVSVVTKEALYWYTAHYGRKCQSPAVLANAWHHRSDALSSIATLIGIGGAIVLGEKWTVLDPIAAVLVSLLIVHVAVGLIRHSLGDLLDQSIPQEEKDQILAVIGEFKAAESPHNLRTRHIGPRHSIEFHVRMDGKMTVYQSHEVTKAIENRLREVLGPDTLVSIHVEPKKTAPNAEAQVTASLRDYIATEILPRYDRFDAAHRRDHVEMVIRQSLDLAEHLGADRDMAYTIAAYHDTGLAEDRATHHHVSGRIVRQDARLAEWFSPAQIETIAQAVEDHRASADHEPRSLYGRIVAEADRFIDPDKIIERTVQYGLANYPELDREGHYRRTVEHLQQKYAEGGYLRLWFAESPNAQRLEALRAVIRAETQLRQRFDATFDRLLAETARK